MNAAQVRARARMAMKKREEEVEIEEIEGGELNLVPYLDIITNIVLFLLASVTSGLILGTINSALPEYSEAAASSPPEGEAAVEPPLQMVATVSKTGVKIFSLSGLEGTPAEPKFNAAALEPGVKYDWAKVTEAAAEIVKRRFGTRPPPTTGKDGKIECRIKGQPAPAAQCRPDKATDIFLVVDGDIPYQAVVGAMDALRQAPDGTILFPGIIFSSGIQ